MKNFPIKLAFILLICFVIFGGCEKSENSNLNTSLSKQNSNNKQAVENQSAKVDTSLQNVASNFQEKLKYYNGDLVSLTDANGEINAVWNSKKCDWFKEEFIDLAISINRGYAYSVKNINAERTCNSKLTKFFVSGDKFNKYKSGKINDLQFTAGIK